jgi:3-deoxy-D-manno-octulosonate 8-phosphate phosphatase (KDO 8-P phosphatase)
MKLTWNKSKPNGCTNGETINNYKVNFYNKLDQIKAIVLDIDGVLTDNTVLVTEAGEFLRTMNVRDGYAIKKAISSGIQIAIISGGRSVGTRKRLEILGVSEIHLGIEDKLPKLKELLQKWDINADHCAYMGDDILDIPCLKHIGIAAAPHDAVSEVIEVSDMVSNFDGGKGCVRELIEKILQAQNLW